MSRCKYVCQQCDNKYTTKSLLQQHQPICVFIHTSAKEEKPILPSPEIMFQYIVHLTKKYEKLEQKIKNIERTANYNKKAHINEYLKIMREPRITYSEWLKQIEVSQQNLDKLFEHDLKMCIQSIFADMLDSASDTPLHAFKEKQNTIYIYDDIWRLMTTEEFARLISIVSHRILQKYMCWANENRAYLEENPKNQDLEMIYMSKANGLNCNSEKLTVEIKKWLFLKICVSIKENE